MTFKAYAAHAPGQPLQPYEFDPGPLRDDQVQIRVTHCGICHSDLSVIDNSWGNAVYPLVPGHEAVGVIEEIGPRVRGRKPGDVVGLGWFSASCLSCRTCLGGHHNLCAGNESTMLGRPGGFADRVRCQWAWATPLPAGVKPETAGPLFCGGITVFNPIAHYGVRPTDRVGVVGIGGLGHLALQFLSKWGCEVTAFTSSPSKREEALRLGAHEAVTSTDATALGKVAGRFDFILVTVNVPLPWDLYVNALGPNGRLHVVGAVLEPIPVGAFPLIVGQKSVSGSPLGSPSMVATMLDFCARHKIAPVAEHFPMRDVNKALDHLRAGKARYRVVLNA
ncbi:MAG: NAD(P)-dependent alcohol dehydrogenase [Phycisphaerales bacterium]|nr:NAD(P)-dependent alcohol dehydrogenase [Phycisphaerales bacterium]